MASPLTITVNEKKYEIRSAPDTPLLYVLRNELNLNGPRMGCGLEQCSACTVLLGARAIKSCKTPVIEVTRGRAWLTFTSICALCQRWNSR